MGKLLNVLVVVLAVVYISYKSPFVDPVAFKPNLPDKLDGKLALNQKLDKTERLFENEIHWPESFAVHDGQLYTGLGDGRIVRLGDKAVTEVGRTGGKCAGQHEEHICGRPLGLAFNKLGALYVADAYHGLISVDIKTGKKNSVLPSAQNVDDLPLTFLNSIAFDSKEEVLYLTQSTTKWNISYVITSIIEHESSGRLLKYDIKTKKVSVLLKDLSFPNGIALSTTGNSLLIALGNANKIIKYHIAGPKKGAVEDLISKLPGEPDNIKKNSRGNFWVGLASARSLESLSLADHIAEMPFLRKVILNVHRMLTIPISAALSYVSHKPTNEIAQELKSLRIIVDYIPSSGAVVEIGENGNIIQALYSPSGSIKHISEVVEHNGYLYLGSWRNRYVGRMKI